jgi:hypothetical protein
MKATIKSVKAWKFKLTDQCEECLKIATQVIIIKTGFMSSKHHPVCDVHMQKWIEEKSAQNDKWTVESTPHCIACMNPATKNLVIDIATLNSKKFPICDVHAAEWVRNKLELEVPNDDRLF